MIVHVLGDASHLALVDVNRYASFVGDWAEDNRLYHHLVEQAQQRHALAWGTGFEIDWRVEIKEGISDRKGFREFEGTIRNTGDTLHLVNYDSLTMAAQFEDHRLPDKETANYQVPLPSGLYRFRIVQLVDPKTRFWETLGEAPAFLLEYETCEEGAPRLKDVPWADTLAQVVPEQHPKPPPSNNEAEISRFAVEMARDLMEFAGRMQPGSRRAYYLFSWNNYGESYGSPGASYGSESEAQLIGALKNGDFLDSMNAKSRQLRRLTGKPKGVFLLIAKSDFTHEIRFEYKKLGRWRITKLDGATGVPEGL